MTAEGASHGEPSDSLRIGGHFLALARGDLTRFPADAIVNAANVSLAGGGGVDGAIHRAGGPEIMADLEARFGIRRQCPTGSAVVSAAGRLPARWVIHAVGPVWRGGSHGEPEHLASAYTASLRLADELGARSIAFPAISCGIYAYPPAEGARVAVETVAGHLAGITSIDLATFVLFTAETFGAFGGALRALRER
jgi:O-acetyl-ADP-ribose deacetylase (regulator of RNase III)